MATLNRSIFDLGVVHGVGGGGGGGGGGGEEAKGD